jgi:hypothetical protein
MCAMLKWVITGPLLLLRLQQLICSLLLAGVQEQNDMAVVAVLVDILIKQIFLLLLARPTI